MAEQDSLQFQSLQIPHNSMVIQQNLFVQPPPIQIQKDQSQKLFLSEIFDDSPILDKTQPKTFEMQRQLLDVINHSPFDSKGRKLEYKQHNISKTISQSEQSEYLLIREPKRKVPFKKKKNNQIKNSYQQLCRTLHRYIKKNEYHLKGSESLVEISKFKLQTFIIQNLKQESFVEIILKRKLKREIQLSVGSVSQKIYNIQILRRLTIQIIKRYQKQTMFDFFVDNQRYKND